MSGVDVPGSLCAPFLAFGRVPSPRAGGNANTYDLQLTLFDPTMGEDHAVAVFDSVEDALRSVLGPRSSIVTFQALFVDARGLTRLVKGNLDMLLDDAGCLKYQTMKRREFLGRIRGAVTGGLVVRSFLPHVAGAPLPVKQIHGFLLRTDGTVGRLDAVTNRKMQCTDPVTKEELEPEPFVEYM
jgi:hypothetical protein